MSAGDVKERCIFGRQSSVGGSAVRVHQRYGATSRPSGGFAFGFAARIGRRIRLARRHRGCMDEFRARGCSRAGYARRAVDIEQELARGRRRRRRRIIG